MGLAWAEEPQKLCPKSRMRLASRAGWPALPYTVYKMELYCVKCKRQTPTELQQIVTTKNGRHRAKGICVVCKGNKSRFVSAKDGKGFLGKVLGVGKIPVLGDIPIVGSIF